MPETAAASDERLGELLEALRSMRNGDFTARLDTQAEGVHGEIATVFNDVLDQCGQFSSELQRVGGVVSSEGRLTERLQVSPARGGWQDSVRTLNRILDDVSEPVHSVAQVLDSVAGGDLSPRVDLTARHGPLQGDLLRLASSVNRMADQMTGFTMEVTRVAREVGTEGKLGGSARVEGVSGAWLDVTDAVNQMASRLTAQVRDISEVTTAVAEGDLTRKVTVDVQGEMLQLKDTVNTMVDQLDSFADEVTRVAREVGTEGKLGGRANVKGVSGIWKDLTDNVNSMANSLTLQVRNISDVTRAVARGDLTKKITVDAQGEILELKDTVNTMVDQLESFADEVTRMAREVGTEGKLGGQAHVRGVSGVWKDLTDNVNSMANNLTHQVRQISVVTRAAARGDLTKKITVNAKGEILELKDTINTMVDQLSSFADEVTRVAREVGTQGALGGRANVPGASGIWKDLTENVNSMAHDLTTQVRNISDVMTAVQRGDLTKKITVDAQGEILELKDTINTMVDQLSAFAGEVTRVAHDVGSEGQLGGQAQVSGVSGTWKQLTESVNELAGNLTKQVRAIGDVASAVTRGDLTPSITVEARGEVNQLKDNINLMVQNLRETTNAQRDEDWLKGHVTRISGKIQGHRDLYELARVIMSEVTPLVRAQYGACFLLDDDSAEVYRLFAGYGYQPSGARRRITPGQGLTGQVIAQREEMLIHDVPGDYVKLESGLGEAPPLSLVILPIVAEGRVLGAVEFASFGEFQEIFLRFLRQLVSLIGATINTILANARTESLLIQSQQLTTELQERSNELQRQQEELRRKNNELHSQAGQLASRNRAIEMQNRQIESARRSLEERARQLQISYKYKSQFLANMSHELRTPLNSLLILARLLADNPEQNLSSKQVEFAKTIHKAGSDLLSLIGEILDLSKMEAGRVELRPGEVSIHQLVDYVEATFRPMASEQGLAFVVDVSTDAPQHLWTDEQRLQQVLRNLLSNAVKFTSSGEVRLTITPAWELVDVDLAMFAEHDELIAFSVTDTGIGIPEDKIQVIFEAFHQGDGGSSRRFGGTGLGLSISRNMSELLGGEIRVSSVADQGSAFTLLLPVRLPEPAEAEAQPLETAASRNKPSELPAVVTNTDLSDSTSIEDIAADTVVETDPSTTEPVVSQVPFPIADGRQAMLSAEESGLVGSGGAEPRDTTGRDEALRGRCVLIVDDDVRNVFALTSALEAHGLRVLYADDGNSGISKLEANEDVALVLMDIMMPELDGNETTRRIREMPQFVNLPIVALTAKAMQGDRERSLDSGASDYVTKPVDLDHLLDVLRSWLDPEGYSAEIANGAVAESEAEPAAAGEPEADDPSSTNEG